MTRQDAKGSNLTPPYEVLNSKYSKYSQKILETCIKLKPSPKKK